MILDYDPDGNVVGLEVLNASQRVADPRGGFDFATERCDKDPVKTAKSTSERKTPGDMAVEKHRPLMNKLTDAQRRKLRQRAAESLYSHETVAAGLGVEASE